MSLRFSYIDFAICLLFCFELSRIFCSQVDFINDMIAAYPTQTKKLGFSSTSIDQDSMEYCDYVGIVCLEGTGKIMNLTLDDIKFNGPLPSSVNELTSLQYFDISRCGLTGRFPEISNLTSLLSLWMDDNAFEGPFPSIVNNERLFFIFASNNRFTGALPSSGYQSELAYAIFDHNQFSANLKDFLAIPSLKYVSLGYNKLSGILSFPYNENIELLDLDGNQLTGPLPDISKFPQLRTLQLSYNQFDIDTYNLPKWTNSPNLRYCDIKNNGGDDTMECLKYSFGLCKLNVCVNSAMGSSSFFVTSGFFNFSTCKFMLILALISVMVKW